MADGTSPARREYRSADGKVLPGVTDIIDQLAKERLIDWAAWLATQGKKWRAVRDAHAETGTHAHALFSAALLGRDEPEPPFWLEPEQVGDAELSADAALRWWRGSGLQLMAAEVPVISQALGVGGTPDVVALAGGKLVVVDLKTGSSLHDEVIIQLGAYAALWMAEHGGELDHGIALHAPRGCVEATAVVVSKEQLVAGYAVFHQLLLIHRLREKLSLRRSA